MSEHISGELLSSYIDDETDEDEKAIIERHLGICLDCHNEFVNLTLLKEQILKEYLMVDIPVSMEDHVMAKIQQSISQKSSSFINHAAIFVVLSFALVGMGATGPFLSIGLHIFNTLFSIAGGLMYAITSILSAIPYMVEAISAVIFILIVLAIFILRYLVNTLAKTVEAGDIS
ncbi:MAG: zf-HC2 domain-containing protein [Bacillota bacterium]|nr:zf-HC2 domain-containing protein [Bacillota bacterium]